MKNSAWAAVILLAGLAGTPSIAGTGHAIFNPYQGVDWTAYGRHKANLHTHTRQHKVRADGTVVFVTGEIRDSNGGVLQAPVSGHNSSNPHPDYTDSVGRSGGSDGAMTPQDKIAAYHSRGYAILALTDHNRVTWPWEDHAQDPEALGMLAVQGCEPSRHHHLGSFFNSYDGSENTVAGSLNAIGNLGGLSTLYHPGRYTESVNWYVTQYETYEHLVGMEVYNQGDRYPNDRAMWDQVLTRLMPHRPVWGYSNDDAHSLAHVSRNWQTFLLPELTEAALRHAMANGHFYFSYAPGGHPVGGGEPAPVIESISVDDDQGVITLVATGHTEVLWISGGVTIASGSLSLDVSGHQGYVRAVLIGPTGRTYTQPFFAGDPDIGTPVPFEAIPVGPEGTALQTFASLPGWEDGWFSVTIPGNVSTVTTAAALDALIQSTPLAPQPLTATSTWPAAAAGAAQWNSAQQRLQTRPTSVAATALVAVLRNETGAAVSALTVSYDFGSWLLQEGETVYGHRAYFSRTGLPGSWTLIPGLSQSGETLVAGETPLTAEVPLVYWPPGEELYLLWVDDNGPGGGTTTGTGREGSYSIDNFRATPVPMGALPVGLEGTALQTFASLPGWEDGWFAVTIPGNTSAVTTAAELDALIQSTPLAPQLLTATSEWPAAAAGAAQWNSAQQRLQTRPTSVAATALVAVLRNETGAAVSALTVSYDFGSWLLQEGETVYGHRAYFSRTGLPGSWTLIPGLSQSGATFVAGETPLTAELPLDDWQPGEGLFLLWADDNGPGGITPTGTGREGSYSIDNFRVEAPHLAGDTPNREPDTPELISPANGATGVSLTPTLQASAFSDPDGDPHANSQWQVDSAGAFDKPEWDSGESHPAGTSATVPAGLLNGNTTYHWRVRYKDSHDSWSAWSGSRSFTTLNRPPATPTLTSPANGATGVSLTPTLQASAFSDPDGDSHANSQWQVDSAGAFSSPEWDSGESHPAGTSATVPAGQLSYGTAYYWRVRYKDSLGAWSAWSAPAWTFAVAPDISPPTVSITSPTSDPSWTSPAPAMDLGGTAADNVGVASVTVVNDRDGVVRIATGADSWHVNGLPLFEGLNIITVTAYDAADNSGTKQIEVTYHAPSWDDGHQDLGGGWRRLEWFGDYAPMPAAGWIWHNRHGFLFVAGDADPGSIWFFAQEMGWIWTSNGIYPFLFRESDGVWLWYNGETNPRWFVNMATGTWESHP